MYLLANPYPPFHGGQRSYPIDLKVEGPDDQRRLVTAFRLVLAIPAFVLGWVLGLVLLVVAFIDWFIALVIGRIPKGMETSACTACATRRRYTRTCWSSPIGTRATARH